MISLMGESIWIFFYDKKVVSDRQKLTPSLHMAHK